MKKTADTTHPIHPLLAERWSPRAFQDRPVDRATLGSLLEAARWAPSSFNAQPWRFLVASRHDDPTGFERLRACLVEGNAWARKASVLVLAVARRTFEHNGKENRHAWHDVGLALACLVVQAQALGLATHQMAGFDVETARSSLGVPEGFDPVTMVAIGHRGDADALPEELAARERGKRDRKALGSIAFGATWEKELGL